MNDETTFDRQLEAWLDGGPTVMPDRAVTAVADRISRQPQRRTWPPDESPTMILLFRLAAVAGIALAVVGGAILVAGGRLAFPDPAPVPLVPSPSSMPTATATADAAQASLAATSLRSTWVAESGRIPSLGVDGPTVHLVINPSGGGAWIRPAAAGGQVVASTVRATTLGELSLTLDRDGSGCTAGAVGRYHWSQPDDLRTLELSAVEDPCASRREALERTWMRSHLGTGSGGVGVLDAFDPPIQITLPPATWTQRSFQDASTLDAPDLMVFALRDPQGFTAPCTVTGGQRREIKHGLDEFEAFIRGLPGFTVTATDETIGGYPARHLDISSVPTDDCPPGTQIIETQAASDPGGQYWVLGTGDPDFMDIVELPDRMVLLQLIPQTTAPYDARSILDSITFLDTPTGAASPAP